MRTSYPFKEYFLCVVPSLVLLACVRIFIGPEDVVFTYFTKVRATNPSFTFPMEVLTNGMIYLFYPVFLFFLLRGLRDKKPDDILFVLCCVAAQLLIAALLCRIIKIAVGRPRPMTGGPFKPFTTGWGYQSFPSGHTGEALGVSLPFVWRYGQLAPYILPLVFGSIVAGVGFSRLYLGMHHPTDILGGLVIGSISGYVSWAFFSALRTRWQRFLPKRVKHWLEA